MKNLFLYCPFIFLFTAFSLQAQKSIKLNSPDGRIGFSLQSTNGSLYYDVNYKGQKLLDHSNISIKLQEADFAGGIITGKPVFRDTTEDYELVLGKTKSVHTRYREVSVPLTDKNRGIKINLVVKLFNEGVAYCFQFPKQKGMEQLTVLDENNTFKMFGDPTIRALLLPGYTSSHEGLYTTVALSGLKSNNLMDMPALVEFPNNIYAAITEAALLDYAGMYLMKEGGVLKGKLSPLPEQTEIKVKATLPHKSPWRVVMIGNGPGALFENNILTTLNEPSKIKDASWIKPGKTTFPWWNGNVTPDTLNAPGNNFVTQQYYIDFCARNNIQYHSVVEYGLHQWYTDDGVGFQPGPNPDVTKPVPGLDMKQVCDYASTKGVGIRVWVHWAALYPKLDSAFAIFEQWGLKGMMIDFMDRDDQLMVNMQTEMLEKAAQHHLHIQFHGAYKPTGVNRTWPNEYTREGTLNYEVNKWDTILKPDHDLDVVYTRGLAGSTDYHLGGFRAVPDSLYKVQYTRPLMHGTRCHMLGMYVVLENYLQMVCDYPAAYEGQEGFSFISEIPTTWDETKIIGGKPGSWLGVARRKGSDWYIGAINNHEGKEVEVPLSFLADGQYQTEQYTDAADAGTNPNHLVKRSNVISNNQSLKMAMAGGGGFAIHLTKK